MRVSFGSVLEISILSSILLQGEKPGSYFKDFRKSFYNGKVQIGWGTDFEEINSLKVENLRFNLGNVLVSTIQAKRLRSFFLWPELSG